MDPKDRVYNEYARVSSEGEDVSTIKLDKWKYDEAEYVCELMRHIGATYDQHYVCDDGDLQAFDIINGFSLNDGFYRGNAITYILRYGKKDGHNRNDILKAIHQLFLLLYCNDKRKEDEKGSTD